MPTDIELLDRNLEIAYTDTGAKAVHFAQEKNRLETLFATLSVPAIISLGSLWASSDSPTFFYVALFSTGFFFCYAALIARDLWKADGLRRLAILNNQKLDEFSWDEQSKTSVSDLLEESTEERNNYVKLYSELRKDFYLTWFWKIIVAVAVGLLTAGVLGSVLEKGEGQVDASQIETSVDDVAAESVTESPEPNGTLSADSEEIAGVENEDEAASPNNEVDSTQDGTATKPCVGPTC